MFSYLQAPQDYSNILVGESQSYGAPTFPVQPETGEEREILCAPSRPASPMTPASPGESLVRIQGGISGEDGIELMVIFGSFPNTSESMRFVF